jgi:hypothetical protein
MKATFNATAVNTATARWLRKRNPTWSAERVERQILRTYVIDEHPDWDAGQIEDEVGSRLGDEDESDLDLLGCIVLPGKNIACACPEIV